jgi:DNA helicase-2/ATP-dependent DNA helicase PcrA
MISLDILNLEQKRAAETVFGPVLILAGAGSGKTRTVTYRIAHMIENLNIPGNEILAVSFTNKAAHEMRERVDALIPAHKRKGITLSTFHSLGIRILREEISRLGMKNLFTIYDTSDQLAIVRDALKHYHGDKNFERSEILSKIGKLKNKAIGPNEFANSKEFDPDEPYDLATEFVYAFYQDKMKFYNALDFDDILFLVVKIFKNFPEVATKFSNRFKFIMIDEYQDTNQLQFDMIKALTSKHNNICVVGDDDQAIYAFRGADISNILNFEIQHPDAKIIKLEENYRSQKPILDLANAVIKQNTKRKDKTMRTSKIDGEMPLLWQTQNAEHEAQIVAEEIIKLQKMGTALSNIAILYRGNNQLAVFEDELRLQQIPASIIGAQKFYEKKEVKDLIAYMCLMQNPRDEISLRRIINVPHRGIGNTTLEKLITLAEQEKKSLYDILCTHPEALKNSHINNFTNLIKEVRPLFMSNKIAEGIEELVKRIGFMEYIDKSYDHAKLIIRKKDDVLRFIESARRFQNYPDTSLRDFIEKLLLTDNQDKDEVEKKHEVTLMTLHSSKGLEFDYIFLVGMEEELLPHKRCIQDGTDINEELRLCYVGVTRARKQLFMTYCKERKIYNKDTPRSKSRFLNSIENLYVEQDRTSFGHLTKEEAQEFKKSFFADLAKSIK